MGLDMNLTKRTYIGAEYKYYYETLRYTMKLIDEQLAEEENYDS